jgi:hypothetical protein
MGPPPVDADGRVVAVDKVEEARQEYGEEHADDDADGRVLGLHGSVAFPY